MYLKITLAQSNETSPDSRSYRSRPTQKQNLVVDVETALMKNCVDKQYYLVVMQLLADEK